MRNQSVSWRGGPSVLAIENVDCYYGDFQALRDVTMEIREGQIVALLGPNAAGKSTTLTAISGVIKYPSGRITFEGYDLTHVKPEKIVAMGIAHVPEGRRLFNTLTVKENLELGAYPKHARARVSDTLEQVYALFPVLQERTNQQAGSLSGGEQQMCAIARGLMAQPRLLMIDEMSLGLSPILVKQMFDMIRRIAESGVTILLVEQQVHHTMEVADYTYIMEKGHIMLSGPTQEIAGHAHVKKAYLGM
ncbi:MAG: ABC transporter ATP-binding protein [Desulfobacterales bacterium]|nr:MAG: ABC transporter ATP-binding protein [Desulfobacterales bacterium]